MKLLQVVGVDIGGTKCGVSLGNHEGEGITVIDRIKFPTETSRGVSHTVGRIMDGIEKMLEKHGMRTKEISAIGISCGGPLDSNQGIILSPPNLVGWDRIPIKNIFEEKFGVPTHVENDANACALAEWRFGAGRGCKNMIFLTFGTGMGAGLILDGRLYSGTNGMAGEVGHMRLADVGPVGYGKAGSFEGFCSGGGIAQLAKMKVLERLQMGHRPSFCEHMDQMESLDAKIVAVAAQAGDELAKEIYRMCGTYLGYGISLLIDVLNPEMIVIGSIFCRSMDLLWPSSQAVIEREALEPGRSVCRIVPAELGEEIGDYAALAVAVNAAEGVG